MGRFSKITKTGYNKQIIDRAKLEKGSRVTLSEFNGSAWFIGADDTGITVDYVGKDGKYAIHRVYDETALGGSYTALLTGIEGIPMETISLYSSNPAKYSTYNKLYDIQLAALVRAGARERSIIDADKMGSAHCVVMLELTRPIDDYLLENEPTSDFRGSRLLPASGGELPDLIKKYGLLARIKNSSPLGDLKKITLCPDASLTSLQEALSLEYELLNYFSVLSEEVVLPTNIIATIYSLAELEGVVPIMEASASKERALHGLLEAGAVLVEKDKWSGLTTEPGPLLVQVKAPSDEHEGFYGSYGYVSVADNSWIDTITVNCSTTQKETYQSLSQQYEAVEKFAALEALNIEVSNIAAIYSLAGLPPHTSSSEPIDTETEGLQPPFASGQWGQSADRFADDLLPDMTGFESATLGGGVHTWNSPGFLLADRDLQVGESVKAWAVNERDGRLLKCVHFSADKNSLTKDQWPKAFLSAVTRAPLDAQGNKWLEAGYLSEVGDLAIASAGLSTAGFKKLTTAEKRNLDRLWHYADGCRLITNAPFKANQVIAGHLPDLPPANGDTVSVQVRDRTTLRLYETHLYKPPVLDGTTSSAWSKGLCDAINRRHLVASSQYGMLRAGTLDSDGVTIRAAANGNVLWIPQNSNLSVELDALTWRKYRSVGAFTPTAGSVIKFHFFDQYSSTQLPGSPFCYTIPEGNCGAEERLNLIAAALKASALGDYVRLGDANSPDGKPTSTVAWHLWVMPLPARVVVQGLPGLADSYEPALETPEGQLLTLGELYEGYKDGLSLTLSERWSGQTVANWTFKPDAQQAEALPQWVQGLARVLEEPLASWGVADGLSPLPEIDLANLSAHTIWLPQGLQSLITAERTGSAPAPSTGSIPDLHPEFTYLRDYLMWEEAEKYAQLKPEENAYVTAYHHYFSKIIAFGEGPLTTRDQTEVRNRPHREFSHKLVKRPDFDFYIPSANVPVLVASRLSQGDVPYPQQDIWQFRMTSSPPHYSAAINCDGTNQAECISCNEHQLVITFSGPNPDASPSECLHLQLNTNAIEKGIRFISYTSDFAPDLLSSGATALGGFRLYIPTTCPLEANEVLCSASRVSRAGITPPRRCLSPEGRRYPQTAFTIHQPYSGRTFIPKDSLCADYANTVGSAVYDVSGASANGVDAKTGLFHAHYPVGVIRGLSGKGPEIDLTLHYSATRANESALGDGWALCFSVYDNRLHKLTLHNGQTITLTADHIEMAKGTKRLAINGVTLTGATGNYTSLSGLTVILPSGRIETLAKPSPHDGQEASEDYKQAFIRKLRKINENLQQWLKESGLTVEQTTNFNNKIAELNKLESEMDRKAFMLVPASITSPQGGTLTLSWESKKGHVHLNAIADGAIELLTAKHDTPTATGTYSSTFTVWPGTEEAYTVSLTIVDCLLTQLQRQGKHDTSLVQSVVFGYEGEPVLDRVLCSVAEEDGSLEYVSYAPMWKDWDTNTSLIPLSRVVRHTLLPGAGQRPITHIWEWEGKNSTLGMKEGETFTATRSLETGTRHHGPSTRRTWQLKNGVLVETLIVATTPGFTRETTEMTYPDVITSTDPTVVYRLATQPIRTTVTTEDLHPNTINPAAQGSTAEDSVVESQP